MLKAFKSKMNFQGKNRNMPDALAQAGLVSGEGRNYKLPFSGKDQIRNLDRWSNVNREGVWMFQLGPLDLMENVKHPATQTGNQFDPDASKDCSLGSTLCHRSSH